MINVNQINMANLVLQSIKKQRQSLKDLRENLERKTDQFQLLR
ncbi:unnamed protein product [Paramecium octaurelia]|uniref:Uncharacterized protein n=1 Tax=Paramecium octaurelia TaxID=43137 RepID=A0A8S1WT70_PAROT|nr:unnamed protein product [Paramecium octaurelia]